MQFTPTTSVDASGLHSITWDTPVSFTYRGSLADSPTPISFPTVEEASAFFLAFTLK